MNGEILLAAFANSLKAPARRPPPEASSTGLSAEALVNGHATAMVYQLLTRDDRREHGVFFSGTAWAQRMVATIDVAAWTRYVDPSAGTGDLLMEIGQHLPLEATVGLTLKAWGAQLGAVELRDSFLHIAWSRLQALARVRHSARGDRTPVTPDRPMPASFQVGNALDAPLGLRAGDCVIMNPPYQRMTAPKRSFVGGGLRSAAGLHVERVVREAPPGVGIVALVPDVLRCGSSYHRFRAELSERVAIEYFDAAGCFGESADVDVAILVGVTQAVTERRPMMAATAKGPAKGRLCVGDACHVSVGPVVPHRTAEDGIRRGYLTARNAIIWGEIKSAPATATFEARVEQAPFVVVRRTSSPSDRQRARASVVAGTGDWLIENHLIVVRPRTKTLRDCRRLLAAFADPRTDAWLNGHIRCRHLTVGAIKAMPWWDC